MKNTIITVASVLSFLIAPAPAFALFTVGQGGTGQSTFTSGALLYGNGTSPISTTGAGTLGYVLQFNGTFPTWVSTSSLGVVTHPGGSTGQIQFNDGGSFGGDSKLTYDKTGTGQLTVGGADTSTVYPGTHVGLVLNSAKYIQFNDDPIGHYSQIEVQDATTPGNGTELDIFGGNSNGPNSVGGQLVLVGGTGRNSAGTGPAQSLAAYINVRGGKAEGSGGDLEMFGASSQVNGGGIYLNGGPASGYPGTGGDGGDIVLTPGSSLYGATGNVKIMATNIQMGGQTLTVPNDSGTFGLLEANQTWAGTNTFSKGAGTTTVNFGTIGDATSHTCFNTKNTDGNDISFFFVGTSMVVENNACQ